MAERPCPLRSPCALSTGVLGPATNTPRCLSPSCPRAVSLLPGPHQLATGHMSAKATSSRKSRERAARPRSGLKQTRLRDQGDSDLWPGQGSDLQQQQLRQLAQELQARWVESPDCLSHALDGLHLAYLIGLQGARSLDYQLNLLEAQDEAPQDGILESHRIWDKLRAKSEQGCGAESMIPHQGNNGPRKAEARGNRPSRRKGKCKARPGVGASSVELPCLQVGKQILGRLPLRNCSEPRPQGGQRDQLSPPDSPHTTSGTCRSRWQRELESTFEGLLDTNRRLKKHLGIHLRAEPRLDQNPKEEPVSLNRPGDVSTTSPCQTAILQPTSSQAQQNASLGELDGQSFPHVARVPASTNRQPLAPDTPAHRPAPPSELPRLATLPSRSSLLLSPQERVDRVGLVAPMQMPRPGLEQRQQNHLEQLEETEQLKMNLEGASPMKESQEKTGRGSPPPASRELGGSPLPDSPKQGGSPLPVSEELGGSLLPASKGVGGSYLRTSRELRGSSPLTSREWRGSSVLTSRELGGSSLLVSRELKGSSVLTSRELGCSSLLTTRELGASSLRTSRELGNSPQLMTSREPGGSSLLTSQESGNSPRLLTSRELGDSPPLLTARELGGISLLTSQELGRTSYLSPQESGSSPGTTDQHLASLLSSQEQEEETGSPSPCQTPLAQSNRQPRDLKKQHELHQQFLEAARKRLREFQEVK